MKTHTLYVSGIHCQSCTLLIEQELSEVPQIERVRADLTRNTLEVVGNFDGKTKEEVAATLSALLIAHGYTLSAGADTDAAHGHTHGGTHWREFRFAIPLALIAATAFVLLQKAGLINLVPDGPMSYSTAFIVGMVASLSSCMAVVGGVLLSLSATFAKKGSRVRPQLLFHAGRLASFFLLGGVIGALGAVFTLSAAAAATLGIIIGLIMLVLGINLLETFHFTKRLQPTMPQFISRRALKVTKLNHTLTPLLVGMATFFLPCGFTQSMQLYTLTTGHFMTGGLTMLAFALGTLPVLALISFSSFSIKNSAWAGIFFKTAGLVVIMFAVFNIINSLVIIGIIPPVFDF